jgi:hypothetical protein
MAGAAFGFQFGMRRTQCTGRNKLFHRRLRAKRLRRKKETKNRKKARPKPHQYICTAKTCRTAVAIKMKNSGR